MKTINQHFIAIIIILAITVSCGSSRQKDTRETETKEASMVYRAKLSSLNQEVTGQSTFVHGVNEETVLPESVQSLPDVPAMVTLPVACGALEK